MRFLLLANNNSLSHLAKCLALRKKLVARGHEVLVAVGVRNVPFLERFHILYVVLPDIQEADGFSAPTFGWFRPQWFEACVRAEAELLREMRPDRVLGVFRFTGPISAALAGVPYDSLICGCMIPQCTEVLGFAEGETGRREQAEYLAFFRHSCASRINTTLKRLNLPPIVDLLELLLGDRTFLWDFPEFLPLEHTTTIYHVGPIWWQDWPRQDTPIDRIRSLKPPVALVSFGTTGVSYTMIARPVQILLDLGWSVVIAAGGHIQLLDNLPQEDRLIAMEFVSLNEVLTSVNLVLCHGGQGVVFESLKHRVPILVLPTQPEQSHNGLCLERLGCGRRIFPARPYRGLPVHLEDSATMTHKTLEIAIASLLEDPQTSGHLDRMSQIIQRYDGGGALVGRMEQIT
jgi:UDP:flavonoid glycosyltransferase YjiC (YdhE family)